jgi:hypothetical protein
MNRRRALAQLSAVIRGRAPKRPDWALILKLASEQLFAPQLYRFLAAMSGETAPRDVWIYVEEVRRRSRLRNEQLSRTLGDALAALNAAGVEPVLLKGCARWSITPPSECDRLISDLDLLVNPHEMQMAVVALSAAGFEILDDDRLTRDHDVVVLGRAKDVGAIDLHQHLPGPRGLIDIKREDLRAVRIAGGAARALSPELQILTAALHDQLHDAHYWHGGFDIRHLVDIAELAEGAVDWKRLASASATPLVGAALTAQLIAARFLVGARVPKRMCGGLWGRVHFWRQQAQFAWPLINVMLGFIRGVRGVGEALRWLSAWLARRSADGMTRYRDAASSAISARQCVSP